MTRTRMAAGLWRLIERALHDIGRGGKGETIWLRERQAHEKHGKWEEQ
jgi:hypothetical protein